MTNAMMRKRAIQEQLDEIVMGLVQDKLDARAAEQARQEAEEQAFWDADCTGPCGLTNGDCRCDMLDIYCPDCDAQFTRCHC